MVVLKAGDKTLLGNKPNKLSSVTVRSNRSDIIKTKEFQNSLGECTVFGPSIYAGHT